MQPLCGTSQPPYCYKTMRGRGATWWQPLCGTSQPPYTLLIIQPDTNHFFQQPYRPSTLGLHPPNAA